MREPLVDRFHYVAPKIDVVSIGAGGGSIVQLDLKTKLANGRAAFGRLAPDRSAMGWAAPSRR